MKSLKNNQQGLVSITVSLIFIMIITVITISFALLMRREQRQALDRQLSTQAFYAAESGVNDALQKLYDDSLTSDLTDCDQTNDGNFADRQLDSGTGVEYTCVLIDRSPTELVYDPISPNQPRIIPIIASSRIVSIKIGWEAVADDPPPRNFATNTSHHLPTASHTNHHSTDDLTTTGSDERNYNHTIGVLHASLSQGKYVSGASALTPANMITYTQDRYLYPVDQSDSQTNTTTVTASPKEQGGFVDGFCADRESSDCSAVFDLSAFGTSPGSGFKEYYLKLSSIYQPSRVVIQAFATSDASGDPLELKGSQAVIDVTGKANDVLRRIQVRAPLATTIPNFPDAVMHSMEGMCKRFDLVGENEIELGGTDGTLTDKTNRCSAVDPD